MNTDFKLQSFAFNPAFSKVGSKTQTQTPVIKSEVKTDSTPGESVTLSTSLKTPRAGSDMAQMVEDLQNNGVLPQSETSLPKEEPKPKLREPSSEYMQMMVDSVRGDQSLGSQSVHVSVNNNGAIALLDDSQFFSSTLSNSVKMAEEQGEFASSPGGQAHEKGHGHGHGHGFKEDALLGGHMGTEVIEKIGHNAHHAVTHTASEATNHAVSEGLGHGAAKIAATKVAAHGSEVATNATHLAHHGAETLSETANATSTGALHVTGETAHHLSTGLEIALGVGTVGAGILAVPLTVNGVNELSAGIKEKDTDKILEGVGGIAVGTRSAATAVVMSGMLTTSEVVGQIANVASSTLTPLGLVHAGVDTVLGVRDIRKGKKTEGWLKVGTGVAIGGAAVIGGLPLTITALVMLGVKVGHKIYTSAQEKAAAKLEAQHSQEQQQQPVAKIGTATSTGFVSQVTPPAGPEAPS